MKQGIAFNCVGSAMLCRALTTNTNLKSLSLAVGFFCYQIYNIPVCLLTLGNQACIFTHELETVLSILAGNKTITKLNISVVNAQFKSILKLLI